MKRFLPIVLTILSSAAAVAQGVSAPQATRLRQQPWPQEVLEAAARIPVQEHGRIKPLDTFAGFQMLRLNGMRSHKTPWDERLDPVAWMLDCFFFPEQARDYTIVRVDDTQLVSAIGVSTEGKNRRDRFSMGELEPGLDELSKQGERFRQKPASNRIPLESQIVDLSQKLPALGYALGFLDFARKRYPTADLPALAKAFPGRQDVSFLELCSQFVALSPKLESDAAGARDAVRRLFASMTFARNLSGYVALIPPNDPGEEAYLSPRDVIQGLLNGEKVAPEHLALVRRFEGLLAKRENMAEFATDFIALSDELVARAKARGEFDKIDLEVGFYKADWFTRGMYGFVIAFLCCVVFWLRPTWKWLYWGGWTAVGAAEIMLITGIVIRCVIRERPPITTPYEAILSIIAAAVLIMLVTEYLWRNALPLFLSSAAGGLGLLVAAWHEEVEGTDTMQPLVAVLDTNFWLATHVTVVTMGYCAGILAALIAHVYIFGKLFGFRRTDPKYHSDLSRMIYGILCFGVLFSTVGTILGGVWANDSWGRFWGWDPKENGALMLVLGYLVVLHARMGGYIREFGVAVSAVVIGIIVMWAFWGVNLYQIGLHSYGFTETKAVATLRYYYVEWTVVAIGIMTWYLERARKRRLAS